MIPDHLRQHFFNLYAIALADLRVHPEELRLLAEFGEARQISREQIEEMLLSPVPFDPEIPTSADERVRCLLDFAELALVDGVVDSEEKAVMTRLAAVFGYPQDQAPDVVEDLLLAIRRWPTRSEAVAGLMERHPLVPEGPAK